MYVYALSMCGYVRYTLNSPYTELIDDAKQGYYNNQGVFYDQDGNIKENTYTGPEPCYSIDPENNNPWRYGSEDWLACRCTECDRKLDFSHKYAVFQRLKDFTTHKRKRDLLFLLAGLFLFRSPGPQTK